MKDSVFHLILFNMPFTEDRNSLVEDIENVVRKYENFTGIVSPKHWRTTGHHISSLKKMVKEIYPLTEATETEIIKIKELGL